MNAVSGLLAVTTGIRTYFSLFFCSHAYNIIACLKKLFVQITVIDRFLHLTFIICYSLLWPPYGIGQAIIFSSCSFFFLSSFPCLFSAVADWMSTILPHMVSP